MLVTAGATGALCAALGAITSPGDEVLILAPFWPLIRGIVAAFRADPVEVPFYDRVTTADDAVAAVAARASPRTAALYVSSPSNPTGRVLPEPWLAALAEWADREGVWLISDEVYEDFVYRGAHVSTARFLPERTLSVFSFSKAYGMAGNRTGYLVGPEAAITQAQKISTHTFYAAPTSGQVAGLRALRDGAAWIASARASYEEVGRTRGRAARGQRARGLHVPVPRRLGAARRARDLGLPRGLRVRRRRARARALVRPRLSTAGCGSATRPRRRIRCSRRSIASRRGCADDRGALNPSSIASIASCQRRSTDAFDVPSQPAISVAARPCDERDERVRDVGRVAGEQRPRRCSAARGRR